MRAAILSIGDELTLGQGLDTNARWLSSRLVELGVTPVEHRTVPDDRAVLADAIATLAARSELLLLTGGLGPTPDDLTRAALGDVLAPGRPLVLDADAERRLREWFEGRTMPAGNVAQAHRPETMGLIPNPHGTAPGLRGEHGGCTVVAMPGPPREMRPMFEADVVPSLAAVAERAILTGTVHAFGLGESVAAERLGPLVARDHEPLVGTTASGGVITARIRARGPADAARRALETARTTIETAWAPYAFGRGETTLATAAVSLLRERGWTLATAESCTGGWLGKMLVDEAGVSDVYEGGWISYANRAKTRWLGVPAATLETAGAVSAPVAAALARGARHAASVDLAVSITGVAGPGPDDGPKPAGTVFIGLDAGDLETPLVRAFRFHGERAAVRVRSARAALQMIRFHLLRVPSATPLLWERREAKEPTR